jgi:hypothetical protein
MKRAKVVKVRREIHKKTFSFVPVVKSVSEDLKLCISIALIEDAGSFNNVTKCFIAALLDGKISLGVAWTQSNKLKTGAKVLQNNGHLINRDLLNRLIYEVAKVASERVGELITITD